MAKTPTSRKLAARLANTVGLSILLASHVASAFTISDAPQFMPSLLPPNLAVTLDDSGSMAWAYVPDSLNSDAGTRRFKSSAYNPLYYNPEVTYLAPVNYDGTPLTTSFTSAKINGYADGAAGPSSRGTVDLSTGYRPTQSYNPSSTSQTFASHASVTADLDALKAALGSTGTFTITTPGPAYYYKYNTTLTGCSSSASDDDCYQMVIVSDSSGPGGSDERQNFANWYSFYRTRNLLTVGAATRAFVTVPPEYRVAWQSINKCDGFNTSCDGWATPNVDSRIRSFSGTHRENFYKWLFRLPADNGTPLRSAAGRAGKYFATSGISSPYAADPQVTANPEYSCRLNFHLMMTDGIWNTDSDSSQYCTSNSNPSSGQQCNNRDNTARTLPDGTAYSTSSPLTAVYRDSNSNSISDITFHYWATDLRPDLDNNLVPYLIDKSAFLPSAGGTSEQQQYWNPKNDPAKWQHLVTFTIGLGLTKWLDLTSPDRTWGGSTNAGAGYQNFLAGTDWPTTGSNQSPGNVYDLWHAAINARGQAYPVDTPDQLSSALNDALTRVASKVGAAAALSANATRLGTNNAVFQAQFSSGDWTGNLRAIALNPDGSQGADLWNTTDAGKIAAHGARNIVTWSGTAGINFTEADLTSAGLWGSIGSTDLLNYLRGDQSKEQSAGGPYRNRSTRLGDVINSDPAYAFTENFGYTSLPEGGYSSATPYTDFLAAKKLRPPMVYVGANDGMLHGFNAVTGEEKLAYVPKAVIPNMPQLANLIYSHKFFVDGSPTAWDAHFGGAWKTVLLGSTGAGGKSVFALDITNPDSFGPTKVLWEINQDTTGYSADLGHTIGQGVVAKLYNGDWAAIFGNGYQSTNQKAILYIVRLSDGALIKKIDTGVGSSTANNGLGTPTLYDANGDDIYDAVYAPDMLGNVWKFDLSSPDPASWAIAYPAATGFPNGAPLFQARSASNAVQPIQARVELARPPAGIAGVMVLFGTGRFFANGDNADNSGQSFYGILDNGTAISSTNRSSLQQQTIATTNVTFRGVDNTPLRTVSTNTVDWTSKRGWYMDLPTSGERVIGTAAIRAGRVIFTTIIPSFDPCTFGGSGWLMEVDVRTGAQLPYTVFDTTGDGNVNDSDTQLAGVPITVGISKQPLLIDGAPTALKLMTGTSGEIQRERNRPFGGALGRESWRRVNR